MVVSRGEGRAERGARRVVVGDGGEVEVLVLGRGG
jgi:hypothetical protein